LLFSDDPKIQDLPEELACWKVQIVRQVGHEAQAWLGFDLEAPIVEDGSLGQLLGSGSMPFLNGPENRDIAFEGND